MSCSTINLTRAPWVRERIHPNQGVGIALNRKGIWSVWKILVYRLYYNIPPNTARTFQIRGFLVYSASSFIYIFIFIRDLAISIDVYLELIYYLPLSRIHTSLCLSYQLNSQKLTVAPKPRWFLTGFFDLKMIFPSVACLHWYSLFLTCNDIIMEDMYSQSDRN